MTASRMPSLCVDRGADLKTKRPENRVDVCAPFVSSMPKEGIVLKLGHALAAVSYVTQRCEGEKTVSFIMTPRLGYERLFKKLSKSSR
jgi:hypothetical protein